jgi:hypothetical protein
MKMNCSEENFIQVDYRLRLDEMVLAGGYKSINVDIDLGRLALEGRGIVKLEAKVFHFNRELSSEDAVTLIRAHDGMNPWEPARVEHLLAYDAQNSNEGANLILALGHRDEVIGHRRVACLGKRGSRRLLYFLWWVFDWDNDHRFLAVRRKSVVVRDKTSGDDEVLPLSLEVSLPAFAINNYEDAYGTILLILIPIICGIAALCFTSLLRHLSNSRW